MEQSHRTDPIPVLPYIASHKTFMTLATKWVKYYNQERLDGRREMDGKASKGKIYELSSANSKADTSVL